MATSLPSPISAGDGDGEIDLPPIAEPEKKHPNLDSVLSALAETAAAKPPPAPSRFAPQTLSVVDMVRVVIEAEPGKKSAALDSVQAVGGQVETTYENLVQAQVPISALTVLADSPGVKFVRRPLKPVPAIISQGVYNIAGWENWQGASIKGQGVKIAVLDTGFQGYTSLLGTELPSSPTVMSFRADKGIEAGSVHGTAVAEIVYDIAPSAQLYLVNFGTEVELGNAVDWLIAQKVDVISHSASWLGSGPGDGTGIGNDMVTKATNAGILWVNSAGNYAEGYWSGSWIDANGNNWLDFQSVDETQNITVTAGQQVHVILLWDDPWGASENNYDLYLLNSATNYVAFSTDVQNGNDIPGEFIEYTAPTSGTYHIAIRKVLSNRTPKFRLFSPYQNLQYKVAAGSLGTPADSPHALAVGAVSWFWPSTLTSYSSQGPTVDGRIKPDLVASIEVSTASYPIFGGTSASAPHVSGAAALVKQAYPVLYPAQVKTFLQSQAVDLGAAGKDNMFGSGLLKLGSIPPLAIPQVSLLLLDIHSFGFPQNCSLC